MVFLEKYLIYNLFEYFVPTVYALNYDFGHSRVVNFYGNGYRDTIYKTSCIKIFLRENKIIVVKSNKILILDLYDLHIISEHKYKNGECARVFFTNEYLFCVTD